jgi:lipoyl(octanoyl) transferase
MTALQSNPSAMPVVETEFRDLGRMDYRAALQLQRKCQQQVIAARHGPGKMIVLLVEHDPPVITVSRRAGARNHLIASESQVLAAGVEICETDRGGDITYHGPGQLVVYPILDLNALNLRLISYLRFLEQVVIDTLAKFNVQGERDDIATGVWVRNVLQPTGQESKICAIGVRVSRWVSMHGVALNVTTNLNHFDLIVPCGLADRSVTSLRQLLGEQCPSVSDVKRALIDTMRQAVIRAQTPVTPVMPCIGIVPHPLKCKWAR